MSSSIALALVFSGIVALWVGLAKEKSACGGDSHDAWRVALFVESGLSLATAVGSVTVACLAYKLWWRPSRYRSEYMEI